MLETKDLILDKGKLSDWKDMYENVWSRPESARYMFWNLTASEEDAKARMERTIACQKSHESWTIYEKKSGRAIGFAGVHSPEPGVAEERGICLGPDYFRLGYGEQILRLLIDELNFIDRVPIVSRVNQILGVVLGLLFALAVLCAPIYVLNKILGELDLFDMDKLSNSFVISKLALLIEKVL